MEQKLAAYEKYIDEIKTILIHAEMCGKTQRAALDEIKSKIYELQEELDKE